MVKKYETSIEEKDLLEKAKAREIVQTIMDFGVSQNQIIQIIYLLSLELENIDFARQVSALISELKKQNDKKKLLI